ncbi:MAG: hypothetical protein EPN34_03005 [Burkholderiaceae bacterium]|nr:MAG: hypothetical protein EPN34_03005 [Burkholderiaceae bacterium]
MSSNLFTDWRDLFAAGPLQVGKAIAYADGTATLQLASGGTLRALGEATVGQHYYVRDGVIQAPAPDLPLDSGEV